MQYLSKNANWLKSLDKIEMRPLSAHRCPSPFRLIVCKLAHDCHAHILPPAFPRCAAWATTINGIVATHIGCQKICSEVEMVLT